MAKVDEPDGLGGRVGKRARHPHDPDKFMDAVVAELTGFNQHGR